VDRTTALIVLVTALGVFGRNNLVIWSGAAALALRLVAFGPALSWLDRYGVPAGLTLLTLAVLAPLAGGRINAGDILNDLISTEGVVALLGGAVAAWICARGVDLLAVNPRIILGLLVGSIIGAVFFKGVPIGPLFAAGLAAVFLFIARAFGL